MSGLDWMVVGCIVCAVVLVLALVAVVLLDDEYAAPPLPRARRDDRTGRSAAQRERLNRWEGL